MGSCLGLGVRVAQDPTGSLHRELETAGSTVPGSGEQLEGGWGAWRETWAESRSGCVQSPIDPFHRHRWL